MSSTDPTKVDFLTLYGIRPRTLLRPFRFRQMLDTKSSSSMKQITQGTTYNSSYGQILRRFITTVGSFSHVTTKIRSLNPSTRDVPLSSLESRKRKKHKLLQDSSVVSNKSWIQKVLNMITRSW